MKLGVDHTNRQPRAIIKLYYPGSYTAPYAIDSDESKVLVKALSIQAVCNGEYDMQC